MKILITYSSWTGNTQKVAHAICEQIGGEIMPMKKVKSWQEYDFIALGFFIDKGFANDEAKEFMSQIKAKNLGIFATAGVEPDSEHAKESMRKVKEFLEKQGNKVEKTFICQGAIDPKLIEKMRQLATRQGEKATHKITPEREARWEAAKTHPDEIDLKNAKKAFDKVE